MQIINIVKWSLGTNSCEQRFVAFCKKIDSHKRLFVVFPLSVKLRLINLPCMQSEI